MKLSVTAPLSLCIALFLSACVSGERAQGTRRAQLPVSAGTPRDAYALDMERRTDAATLRAWEDASRRALRAGLRIAPSFRERVRFPSGEAHAVAYRFTLRRGERLDIRIDDVSADRALFADVFQLISDDMYRHVHAASPRASRIAFEAKIDGEYVVRLQPAIGAGGVYDVTMVADAPASASVFPVQGATARSIASSFGDPRDGGRRAHEGVDIFAPRGTPVVAVADAHVTGVQTTAVGGRVVWLTDAGSGLLYYYAHLDSQHAREGASVRAGEVVGTVGNTGNASGTRPHLHFGVYRPGRIPLDPQPILERAGEPLGTAAPAAIEPVDGSGLGLWTVVTADDVRLRSAPSSTAPVVTRVGANTRVLRLGSVAGWHRVVLDDGTTGFVASALTANAEQVGSR